MFNLLTALMVFGVCMGLLSSSSIFSFICSKQSAMEVNMKCRRTSDLFLFRSIKSHPQSRFHQFIIHLLLKVEQSSHILFM